MKKAFKIFVGCMLGAFITAIVFVVTLTLSLPESNEAYGQAPFADPLVFPIMSMGAAIAGVIVFPFTYFALRTKDIRHCAKIVFPIVLSCVVILTVIDIRYGFYGAYVSLAVALAICYFAGKTDSTLNKRLEDIGSNAPNPQP